MFWCCSQRAVLTCFMNLHPVIHVEIMNLHLCFLCFLLCSAHRRDLYTDGEQASDEPVRLTLNLAREGGPNTLWQISVRSYQPSMPDARFLSSVPLPILISRVTLQFIPGPDPHQVVGAGNADSTSQSIVIDTSVLWQES